MPSLLAREKFSGLTFLDLGITGDIGKIAERFKILSLNRPIEAYVRQSFHRHRCPEPVQCGPKPVLEQPHLHIRLARYESTQWKIKRPNFEKIACLTPSSLRIRSDT